MKRIFLLSLLLMLFVKGVFSQDKFTMNGYVSNLGSLIYIDELNTETWDYTLHNRMNLAWYPNSDFTVKVEFRNQWMVGQTIKETRGYAGFFEQDRGWVDMNWNWYSNSFSLLNTQVDRAYLEYYKGNLAVTLGRQRINWGRTLVWNPNDIFNAYSYYNFDYPEKPGADAIRATYYTGMASSVEVVAKADSANDLTLAALTKFNKWGYDFQFIGGYVNSSDIVIGTGWEGSIKSFSLRGEMSYYHPEKQFTDTTGAFLASVATDYTFGNSLMVQAEVLYNDKKTVMPIGTDLNILNAPATSKSLSFSEWNFFTNISYPVLPILTVNAGAMYYPDLNGYFITPGVELSLTNNLYFSFVYQYFNMELLIQRMGLNIAFARLKWNF